MVDFHLTLPIDSVTKFIGYTGHTLLFQKALEHLIISSSAMAQIQILQTIKPKIIYWIVNMKIGWKKPSGA